MTESQQTEILEMFRSGFYKVLVCTSVGNEGIDVPDCNIVLSYEYSGDEITKIQMKGRARKEKATEISMGSDKVIEQEMTNTYKTAMMYRALNIVKQLDPNFINIKVNAFQREEIHKFRIKAEVGKLKKGRKSDEDYEILCGRCNTFACFVSDIRQLGHDHIVIDKDFADKITRKPHNKPKTYDCLHKKYKMYCKKCLLDWGIIGIRDGLDCIILKIINLKFRNLWTRGVSNYKKWIDVPYNIPEINFEDLSMLLEETLPEEVLKMDDKSIKLYKEELKTGIIHANSIRVMVVGHSGVGKTTLTKRLFGENVDVSQDIESTNSIDVHVRKCKVELESGAWISSSEGECEKNYNKLIAAILMKRSKDKELESNKDTLQPRRAEAFPSGEPSSDKDGVKNRVEASEKEVDETIIIYERNRSADKPKITYNFQMDTDKKSLDFLKLIENAAVESMNDKNLGKTTADLSVWDFAGQHVFYGTHQIFLSRRAVYLLVLDLTKHIDNFVEDDCFIECGGKARHNISEFVRFWLNSIHAYCRSKSSKEPPVILVGTFADKLLEEKRQACKIFSEIREVLAEYEELYDHLTIPDFPIDNTINDANIELLKSRIVDVSKKQSYWDNKYPVRWIFLEKSLIELREQGITILERTTLIEINEKNPSTPLKTEELDLFLRFHHETGLILYFGVDTLENYVVLKPQWLVDSLKCLITAEQFCQSERGLYKMWLEFYKTAILKMELIDEVWKSNTAFCHYKEVILKFMEKLDLIAKPRQNGNIERGNFFIAPCMLKEKAPDDVLEFCRGNCKSTSRLCFSTTSMTIPFQVYHSLIAECIGKWPINKHKGKLQMFCGCCIFDIGDNHLLYVCFTDNSVQIWITKFSSSCREPDFGLCIDVKSFIQCHLGNKIQEFNRVEMYVKCPKASAKQSGHWFRVGEMKEEFICNDHDNRILLSRAELMKYWDSMCLDQEKIFPLSFMSNVPTEKQRNLMAQLIGKEYRSLAFQLGLSEVHLDQISMNERLHTVSDRITAMLNFWVKTNSSKATFEELKKAIICVGKDWKSIFSGIANEVSDA